MGDLARYLLDNGILTPTELEEAWQSKAVYGGRLGTNLVRLGFFSVEELAAHLSRLLDVPLPPVDWLDAPDPGALKVVPMPLVRRYKLLPLRLEKQEIHVVMLDPRDPQQLHFLETASERKVVPYVLPELRLLYLLEEHLGIDRHPRYVNVTTRAMRLAGVAAPQPPKPQRAPEVEDRLPPAPETAAPEAFELDEGELLLEEVVNEEPAAAAIGEAPPASSLEVPALEARFYASTQRDEIVQLALLLARAYCQVAAIFLVSQGTVRGFRALGEGLQGPLEGILLPVTTESIFARPALTCMPFRGKPPTDGIDGRLLELLGRAEAQEVLVQPILLRGRVVTLLYADNGCEPFAETSVAALAAICPLVSQAYERLLIQRRGAGR